MVGFGTMRPHVSVTRPAYMWSQLKSVENWEFSESASISVNFKLTDLTMIQVAIFVNADVLPSCQWVAKINGGMILKKPCNSPNVDGYVAKVFELPLDELRKGSEENTVTLSLNSLGFDPFLGLSPLKVLAVLLAPQKIYSQDDEVNTPLFAQFGQTSIPKATYDTCSNKTVISQTNIWTRG